MSLVHEASRRAIKVVEINDFKTWNHELTRINTKKTQNAHFLRAIIDQR
jgi:hypothetical protein